MFRSYFVMEENKNLPSTYGWMLRTYFSLGGLSLLSTYGRMLWTYFISKGYIFIFYICMDVKNMKSHFVTREVENIFSTYGWILRTYFIIRRLKFNFHEDIKGLHFIYG